ncbi:SRPBCC family protein [Streptomyces pinistramenti]|uniref:SRPBCC family protein n=1 Tax=Streptomyces pinistramenti TaxID=2884812 RepID=UPI002223C3A7|nr:SRPBCC domain-containing protein [Streptomyces pinistramenti]
MGKEFEIRREVVLPATPEEVFAAVTAETDAWMFPTEKVSAVGGRTPEADGVTAWDPPHRFAVRVTGEEGWFNALEYLIEAREGGTAVLRYVHSGVLDATGRDDRYDGVALHTDFYLHTLGQYLRYFAGRPVTFIDVPGPQNSQAPDAFAVLQRALGVTGTVTAGDRLRVQLPGAEPLDAVVDYRTDHFLGLRTDHGLYRFFGRNAFGGPVGISLHLFADDTPHTAARPDPENTRTTWQNWLDGLYAQGATTG